MAIKPNEHLRNGFSVAVGNKRNFKTVLKTEFINKISDVAVKVCGPNVG
jgi:hypothetical protein